MKRKKQVATRKVRKQKRKMTAVVPVRISHDEVWVTKDGRRIEVQDLPESHVKNILRMLLRKRRLDRDEVALSPARARAEFFDFGDIGDGE